MIFLVFQGLFHNFAKSYWNDYSKIRRASIPKWMPAFVLTDYRGEVLVRGANCSTTIVYLIHYDNKNRLGRIRGGDIGTTVTSSFLPISCPAQV